MTNPTDDTNISFEWEQIAGCSLPPAPTADFTFENTHDVVVQFTDQSTGTVASRSWDFDDGSNTSTFTKPLYAFSGAGTFNVCLTATNIGGSDMVCKDVVVTLDPTAVTITGGGAIDFDADSQNDLDTFSPSGCSDEFFAMAPLDTVSWAGLDKNYDTVVLADAQGASLSTSNFCHPSGTYLETLIVNTTSNNFYKVWIPQNTASGVRYIFELLGVPPPPPTAGFSSSSYGLFAFFTDQSSANTTNWAWDFGDGGTSSGASPSHQYASNGTYMVCLTASNAGGSDQNCQNITVNQVATTQVNSNQTIDVDGDSQADLLVEKIVGCGTQAHRFVVQNGTQQSGITKFYPDVIASDALGTSYGTSPFCHPVSQPNHVAAGFVR
ncbi:MAG: PKD domain-containing protein [Gammaproteobacteria bacterium]